LFVTGSSVAEPVIANEAASSDAVAADTQPASSSQAAAAALNTPLPQLVSQ